MGYWNNGLQDGYGMHTWPTGQFYIGEWKEGKMNGWGTCVYPEGERYDG